MTSVLIENVSPKFLPKLKAIAKAANAEFKRFVADTKADKSAKPKKSKNKKINPTREVKTRKGAVTQQTNSPQGRLERAKFKPNLSRAMNSKFEL